MALGTGPGGTEDQMLSADSRMIQVGDRHGSPLQLLLFIPKGSHQKAVFLLKQLCWEGSQNSGMVGKPLCGCGIIRP